MLLIKHLMDLKTPKLLSLDFSNANKQDNKKHYFLKFSIPLALSYWIFESAVHYFWYGEIEFKIIPVDDNELWMRTSIFMLLASFGLFADYTSRKLIEKNIRNNQTENIARAKKQWELIVDTLPQLVIAMDHNARITRVNRTIETWGMGKVNNVDGLYVSDFLKCFNNNFTDDAWTSDWPYIWQQLKNKDLLERKVEKNHIGKTYLYTLRKISDYDFNRDQCFAVLVIDDITTRQDVEKSLKTHALNLEKEVDERTSELNQANKQLKHELYAQKLAEEELNKLQECRLGLLRDLFTAQETERKRIARELHDSIGQSLGATKFKIEELLMNKQNFIDDEYDQFNNLVSTIKDAINEVRHIAMGLRPAMLDDLGALPTLNWFCREFENTYTKIKINLLMNVDESDLSEHQKVVIFRIVQEAMNNVAKHGNATKIELKLSKSSAEMRLCISDNGCGFVYMSSLINKNINQSRCSFGLSSMRERAESTGGKFVIESTPGSGTSVIVLWKNKDALSLDEKITA